MSVSYQHVVNKIPTIQAKFSTYLRILDLLFFFKSMLLKKLLKCSNPQIRAFSRKLSQKKKLSTLLISYQLIVKKVPTI